MNSQNRNRILVVDDEINVCKSIKMAIQDDRYEVDTSLSGEEALKKNKEKAYDLVITDLMMPGISGLDLLKNLLKTHPDIRMIMITGYPTIKTAVESVKCGAFDYVPKPFTPQDLRSIVVRALQSKRDVPDEEGRNAQIPSGSFFLKGFAWLRRENQDHAVIGIVHDFMKTLEGTKSIEIPPVNRNIYQGEVLARITDNKDQTHRVWSPVSGRIVEVNQLLRDNLQWLQNSPYEKGWLIRLEMIRPEEDLQGLQKA